jgi:class 3 adenylate cyclase
MRLFPSAFTIRRKDRIHADAAIREERAISAAAWKVLLPAFTGYAAVDWITAGFRDFWIYVLIRLVTIVATIFLYFALRSRVGHSLRYLLLAAIPTFVIQLIMISNHVYFSPYFAGLGLILGQAVVYAPKSPGWTALVYILACSPSFYIFINHLHDDFQNALIGLSMLMGTIVTCIQHTAQIRSYIFKGLKAKRDLDHELKNRNEEVKRQATELIKRKRFESQFSPQVVSRVLDSKEFYEKLGHQKISTLVVDVKESTVKARTLAPEAYAEVIEEVFDIIAAACLKWNITIDKFTGDGAQAFAGSPEPHPDDLKRTVQASVEILKMLNARHDYMKLRWQGDVQLRFGICEGEALVGFLGKGSMRSFTAIGNVVSLAHRICAESSAGTILASSMTNNEVIDMFSSQDFEKSIRSLSSLKGFEGKTIKAVSLSPRWIDNSLQDIGRCPTCSTPLVMTENNLGIPKAVCPSCSMQAIPKSLTNPGSF